MFKTTFIAVFSFFVSLQAMAIGRVGNGGNIIVCLKPGISLCYGRFGYTGAFYDTYEAEVRYKIKPLSMVEGAQDPVSAKEYALKLIQPLYNYDQDLANNLAHYISTFEADANFVAGMQLMPIPDTGISFIPYNSELRQLVVQREPISPLDRRYVISADLWALMTKADQAHAMLHEVIYRHALESSPSVSSSEYVRYFNALLISGEIQKMSQKEFDDVKWSIFGAGN